MGRDGTGVKITRRYTVAEVGCAAGTGFCCVAQSTTVTADPGRWDVQTRNEAGYGPWSNVMIFNVAPQ